MNPTPSHPPVEGGNSPRRTFTLHLIVALTFAITASARADHSPFNRIIAFGDSLTDTGNFFQMTGYPPPPYYEGRFSNGRVWIEYLAERLDLTIRPGDNYAVAGATTGRDNENDIPGVFEFPGLQDELDLFTARLNGRRADDDALYVIWAGANDFFVATGTPEQTIASGVGNTALAVQRLRGLGARHIMVVNLPDLGLTPLGIASGTGPGLTYVCQAYNGYLDQALDQLKMAGIPTIRLDSFAFLQSLVANSPGNGFTNVTEGYISAGGDPEGFLFWDVVHPTTEAHELLGRTALRALVDHFSPRKGHFRNDRLAHGLNGLVNEAAHH